MSAAFDPYHKWLGIPPAEQPPHHYRLLGLALFEHDADVIEIAADQRMALLRSFHTGPHSDLSQRLLNEVAAARLCLLKPDRRERYDEVLRARLSIKQPPSVFDAVHERKNPPPVPTPAAKAPPPITGAPTKPPAAPPAVNLPPLQSTPPPAPPVIRPSAAAAASGDMKSAAAVKTAGDSPSTAIAVKSPTALAKPAAAPTDAIELIGKSAKKTREIELAPKSNDWDLAIAEACSTQSVVHRRRRRWHVSQSLIQFAIGAGLIAGSVYGGAVGFRMWQDYEAKRANDALFAKKKISPPPPVVSTTTTATAEPPPDNSSLIQPDNQQTEAPNFSSRRLNEPRPSPNQSKPRNPANPDSSHDSPNVPRPADSNYDTGGRQPVPGPEAQRKAGEEIDEILKRDYKQAVGVINKVDLAHTIAQLASETHDDPAKHYVLDDRALTMAIGFCDIDLAANVVRDLMASFQLDPWELRLSALNKLARTSNSPFHRARIARGALPLIDDALAEGRSNLAQELGELSLRMATASNDNSLRDQAREALERVKQNQRRLVAYEVAESTLAANPDDPEANLTVGKFKCFVKQDWQGGMPYIAKSSDEPLRVLAERESKPPSAAADQLSLADTWWKLAADRDDPKNELDAKAIRSRAAYWYRQAMPGLSGINLEKARRRTEGL
jgi:hypothetical protein